MTFTDEQIVAFEGISPIEQAKFYFDRRNADGRTHREMVTALLPVAAPSAVVPGDERAAPLTPNQFAAIRAGCASLQKHGGYAPFGIVLQGMLDRARAASPQATATQAEAKVSEERTLTVTPAMVKAAMPWLTSLHHMRKADKESNVEEAIRAALTAAQPASGDKS